MKYFTETRNLVDNGYIGNLTATRRYLKEHPDVPSVWRWWYAYGELIELEEIPRERILHTPPNTLMRGRSTT
jgi:hypothetical protein